MALELHEYQTWGIPVALALGLLLLYYIMQKSAGSSRSKPSMPPGSLGLPILGENIALLTSFNKPLGMYDFVSARHKRYGSTFKTNVLGHITVFVEGRDTAKFILSNEDKLFKLSTTKSMTDVIGPNSLFESRGDVHKSLRRVLGDPLSMASLRKHLNGMEDVATSVLGKWKGRESVCVLDETTDYAFQIISYILINSRPGPEQDQMKAYFHKIILALIVLPINIPGFAYHKGIQARKQMHSLLDAIITKRRKGDKHSDDFLQSVLDKRAKEDGYMLSDEELKDNLIAILFAGHETSATSLMWAMKFIEENPSIKEQLLMEHTNLKLGKGSNEHLTWEEVNSMVYTNKFINEVLRVANIAGLLPREVLEDSEINGYLVKKGWKVVVDTHAPHFDANHFDNPQDFIPSRFDGSPKPFTFMPFGGGLRMCLGMNLAKVEMAIFIHHLMISYRWNALSKDSALSPTLVPKLKNGYPVKIENCN